MSNPDKREVLHMPKHCTSYLVTTIMLCMTATNAWASSITPMFHDADPSHFSTWSDPTTSYLEFEALETVVLTGVEAFGQPATSGPLYASDQFRWQLFQTTSDWQTPDGNGDRLFYATTIPQNNGLANYFTGVFDDPSQSLCGPVSNPQGDCPPSLILQSGAFYRLSLQITGQDDWFMQWHQNGSPLTSQPFTTADGLFLVYGYGDGTVGPLSWLTNSWSLATAPVPTPEPSVFYSFVTGLGLFGMARIRAAKRR